VGCSGNLDQPVYRVYLIFADRWAIYVGPAGRLNQVLQGSASDISQQVLRTDVAGMPLEWIDYREAVRLYHTEQVAYACGTRLYTIFGGHNAMDGRRSRIDVSSIIATEGTSQGLAFVRDQYIPPLNNRTLFKRDANLCLYCASRFQTRDLTRDHITPLSQGGSDTWNNVATACRRCNNYKGGRTPEQAALHLIAVPITPTYAEYIYLKGRRVLVDQMQYLLAHIPRSSPLHSRLSGHLSDSADIFDESLQE
jgi:5-methylcytosine-specific restriction endonuclease McrA